MRKQREAAKPELETGAILPVIGEGVLNTGARFVLVPSQSEAGRVHVVAILPGRLSCDCVAGRYSRVCRHRKAVRAYLVAQLERAHDTASASASASVAASRGTPSHPGDTAMMRRSQRPFSLLA